MNSIFDNFHSLFLWISVLEREKERLGKILNIVTRFYFDKYWERKNKQKLSPSKY